MTDPITPAARAALRQSAEKALASHTSLSLSPEAVLRLLDMLREAELLVGITERDAAELRQQRDALLEPMNRQRDLWEAPWRRIVEQLRAALEAKGKGRD